MAGHEMLAIKAICTYFFEAEKSQRQINIIKGPWGARDVAKESSGAEPYFLCYQR